MPAIGSKLQPDRTIALRGFDNLGAAAALHSASATGFTVSGVFRDPSDFAVLILYDADNFYEHLRIKYLPDFDFSGVVLTFDLRTTGLQPIDSAKYPTIDWPYLDVIREDGSSARIRLSDHATVVSGQHAYASATIGIMAGSVQAYDRVTLWYQNYAFDYIASGGETAGDVASALAKAINSTSFPPGYGISAQAAGGNLLIRARTPGADGNHISMYGTWKTDTLKLTSSQWRLTGGSSDVTWRVRLDFSALGIDRVRLAWLTFAPATAVASEYQPTEWEAEFTNWTVEDPQGVTPLKAAGEGSVLVSSEDRWVKYSGDWVMEHGFYESAYARRAGAIGDSAEITYWCHQPHELWIGTALYVDRGIVEVSVDDGPPVQIDCYLANEPQVITRRRVGQDTFAAGKHKVKITLVGKNPASSGQFFYLDYLQAVVRGDPPEPIETSGRLAPANDYGTDHGYKLSPQRLMWMMDELGYGGEGNVYVSVFWWNQRKASGRIWPEARIDFATVGLQSDDQIFVDLGGSTFGKTVFPQDTASTVAYHFAAFINEVSVGVWARAAGSVLAIRPRAIASAYEFPVSAWLERGTSRQGIAVDGSLSGGVPGTWVIDPDADPPVNVATRKWLADLCAEHAKRGRQLVLAYSMELLYPPDDPAAGEVWAARFPDGQPVVTDTGFGGHKTTHCTFSDVMRDYQKRVYAITAEVMRAAGLEPWLQFGEFLWWFFANASGMAFYDEYTKQRARDRLGRELALFRSPDDDPSVNGYQDANLLAEILVGHCREIAAHVRASVPEAKFELLLALDVNAPKPSGRFNLGGRLNYHVNVPVAFRSPATAPFDRLKIEALNFTAWSFNLDLAGEAIRWYLKESTWPRDSMRYNVPVFRGGGAWEREYHLAILEGIPKVMMWAFDHICLYSLPGGEPILNDQSAIL